MQQPEANGLASPAKSQDGTEASTGAPAPSQQNSHQPVPIGVTLQKDAFLVFRALCKLSIRSSDNSASADITVMRGKVQVSPEITWENSCQVCQTSWVSSTRLRLIPSNNIPDNQQAHVAYRNSQVSLGRDLLRMAILWCCVWSD